ncbi:MAG: lytic transglycosylase domain-containing protein [Armatimonadota bacterium]
MLENVTSAMARVEEIKSRFRSARVGGEVSIAPRTFASPPKESDSVQPFFPSYLIQKARNYGKNAPSDISAYKQTIESTAAKYGIDSALLKAVIRAESGFNPNAMSGAGAQGLMQLMPSTAKSLGCSDPFDPAQNIEAGAKYLKQQLDRFGSVEQALAAYNAGPGAVAKYNGVPPFRETQGYIQKVLTYRDDYASQ